MKHILLTVLLTICTVAMQAADNTKLEQPQVEILLADMIDARNRGAKPWATVSAIKDTGRTDQFMGKLYVVSVKTEVAMGHVFATALKREASVPYAANKDGDMQTDRWLLLVTHDITGGLSLTDIYALKPSN